MDVLSTTSENSCGWEECGYYSPKAEKYKCMRDKSKGYSPLLCAERSVPTHIFNARLFPFD